MSNQIYWVDNETPPNWYTIVHSESRDGTYTSLGTTSSTTYEHSEGDLDTWYKINASYANGTSDWSLPFQAVAESTADMCIVWGKIRDADLRYPEITTTVAEATPVKMPHIRTPMGINYITISSNIDTQGYFQLRLYRNIPVKLEINVIGYSETIVVPNTSSKDFSTIKPVEYRT